MFNPIECIRKSITNEDVLGMFEKIAAVSPNELGSTWENYMKKVSKELYDQEALRAVVLKVKNRLEAAPEGEAMFTLRDMVSLASAHGSLGYSDLHAGIRAKVGQIYTHMPETLKLTESNLIGTPRGQEILEDAIRMAHHGSDPNFKPRNKESIVVAKELQDTMDYVHAQKAALGDEASAQLNKKQGFLPSFASARQVMKMGFDEYFRLAKLHLKWKPVFDSLRPDKKVEVRLWMKSNAGDPWEHPIMVDAMRGIHGAQATGGLSTMKLGTRSAYEHPDWAVVSRKLEGKTGEDYLSWQNAVSEQGKNHDWAASLHGWVGMQGNDIATWEKWSYQPDMAIKEAADWAGRIDAKNDVKMKNDIATGVAPKLSLQEKVRAGYKKLTRPSKEGVMTQFKYARGEMNETPNVGGTFLNTMRGFMMPKIMKATIPAFFGDATLTKLAGQMNGLDTTKMMRLIVTKMDPTEAKDFMVKVGLGGELTSQSVLRGVGSGEAMLTTIGKRFSEGSVKISFLKQHTAKMKLINHWGVLSKIAEVGGKSFDEADKLMKGDWVMDGFLTRYGFTPDELTAMHKAVSTDLKWGSKYVDVSELEDTLQHKLLSAMTSMEDMAVIEGTPRSQYLAFGKSKAGRTKGEARRAMMQFKQHPIAFMQAWMARPMFDASISMTKYYGYISGTMLMAGAGMVWANDMLTKGQIRNPAEDPTGFFFEAMAKGGGLGFTYDVLYNGAQFYQGSTAAMAGPLAQDVGTLLYTGGQFAITVANGDYSEIQKMTAEKFAGKASAFVVKRTTDALWYTSLVSKRWVSDYMRELEEPGYMANQRKDIRKARVEKGTKSYWAPGKALPLQ